MSEHITIPDGTDYIFCGISRKFHQAVHFYLLVKKINDEGLNIEVHPAMCSPEWAEEHDTTVGNWVVAYVKAAFPAVTIGELRQVRYNLPDGTALSGTVTAQKHRENSEEMAKSFVASVPSGKKVVIYTGDVELPDDATFAKIAESTDKVDEVEAYKQFRNRERVTSVSTDTHGDVPIMRPFVENNVTAYDVYKMMKDNDLMSFLDHTSPCNFTNMDGTTDTNNFPHIELEWVKTQYA